TSDDLQQRVEILERHTQFHDDPDAFVRSYEEQQEELHKRIVKARKNLALIKLTRDHLLTIAEISSRLKLDGHRGELTIARAARALAAFENRKVVNLSDIERVVHLALRHRLRRDPFEATGTKDQISRAVAEAIDVQPTIEKSRVNDSSNGSG